MKFEVKIEYEDYKAAQKLHMTPRRKMKSILYLLSALLLSALIISVLCEFLAGNMGEVFKLLGIGLAIIAYVLLLGILLSYKWRKIYSHHKLLQKPVQMEFTVDAFCFSSEFGNAVIPWGNFHKWKEGKTLFLVYQTDNMFHMIPKRVFQNVEDQEWLRNILKERIGIPVN